jgi:pimeloyl-ACP methyl ester carboxylesterase
MKNHRHDIAIFFSDPQDKVLGEEARRWPPLERKITPSLYTLVIFCFALFAFSAITFAASDTKKSNPVTKPTIVLVHGAFAESSSWNGVVKRLLAQGYPVVAAANPLRGLHSDAEYIATIFKSIPGPIVAVGHSYGGSVITDAAAGSSNVKALVYVAGLAPDTGESAADIGGRFPGSTLGPTLAPPTTLADGGKDLYIQQDKGCRLWWESGNTGETHMIQWARRRGPLKYRMNAH